MIAPKPESNPLGNPVKVLHLEDSDADHMLVKRALEKSGLVSRMARVDDRASLIGCLEREHFDIVLMDYRLTGFTALDAWSDIKGLPTRPPCVLVSGAIGETAAVAAIQTGISDYLHKDNLQEIGRVVLRALKSHRIELDRQQASKALLESEQRITELARHLQSSLDEERAAISREVHDEIGGSLAAMKLDVAWLKRHVTDKPMLSRLDAVQEMLGQALSSTQRIMKNTRPAILDQGLGASVQWLTQAHTRRVGSAIELRCRLADGETLTDGLRLTAYRTVQESLTNISKYAPDANVLIELSDEGQVLTVEITDDGPGFDTAGLGRSTGFGLRGLGERAKNTGGWLDISSAVGRGTSVTLTVPIPPQPPRQAKAGNP